jgi:hypothetical protein
LEHTQVINHSWQIVESSQVGGFRAARRGVLRAGFTAECLYLKNKGFYGLSKEADVGKCQK